MWYVVYNLLLIAFSPAILLVLLAKKRCRRGIPQRLGLRLPAPSGSPGPTLWVHAVSLGEVVAVAPLVQALHRRYPACRILVSTVTETGREAVERRLAGVATHCYAPLDAPWTVSRVAAAIAPAAFLFVETELWPNLLRVLARRGVPCLMVNGRLSSRSFGRYRLIRPFMEQVLGGVHACLMQSARDAERIAALGARRESVHVTGNLKFDQPLPARDGLSREALGLAEGESLFAAGSTHPGEEEQILTAYASLVRSFPSLVLLLAPRHIERVARVEAAVRAAGLVSVRRTDLASGKALRSGPRVVILDTRGELAVAYRHAEVAFVGGTLAPVGGHNLLEPAQWGRPVLFGPHTDHCAEVARVLLDAGGGACAVDAAELERLVAALLRDKAGLEEMGRAAQAVVADHRGALERSLELIGAAVEKAGRLGGPSALPAQPAGCCAGGAPS
jgi:3-deoxy-D-manno-octulosonic-acid transferase